MTLINLMIRVRDFGPCWSRTKCGPMAMMKTSKRWGTTRSGPSPLLSRTQRQAIKRRTSLQTYGLPESSSRKRHLACPPKRIQRCTTPFRHRSSPYPSDAYLYGDRTPSQHSATALKYRSTEEHTDSARRRLARKEEIQWSEKPPDNITAMARTRWRLPQRSSSPCCF